MALTDRQKQIKKMLDQKKTPGEVAHALGITENAVYQQRRRIREIIAAEVDQRPAQPAKPRTRQRKSAPSRKVDTPSTPLQAIRARKTEIETRLGAATEHRDKAVKALEAATEHLANVESRVADELARLKAAEEVLTAPEASTTARHGRRNGSSKAGAATNEPEGAFSE